mgnify:CR=1 FL=1
MRYSKPYILALFVCFGFVVKAHTPLFNEAIKPPIANTDKQLKMEGILTSKKWICLEVSKKKMTKKLSFDVGNEINFTIDKKYNFKNNNYDYGSGTWKMDGKYLYFFYNAPGTENKVETMKYKILKLSENELYLKRMDKPRGKLTFK